MHALHNASLIRKTLPRHHYEPKPYLQDREAEHTRLAKVLQVNGPIKRAKAQAKAAETRAKNKAARAGATEVSTAAAGNESTVQPGVVLLDDEMQIELSY